MSFDAVKEDESVVGSSVTEWKHDVEALDPQESQSHKVDEDACRSGAEEQGHSCDRLGTSSETKRSKLYGTRYFIIKSLNHQNLQLSIEKGIWATQVMNEPILEEAYHNSGKVILIFSVNMSGFFQGYTQMMSSVGWRRDNVWSQGSGGSNPWGRIFKVKWLRLHDLPFQKTLHLKNPLNQYKPVKISRDCQELPQDIGEALCELLDGENQVDDCQKRDDVNSDLPSKRPCTEPSYSVQNEEYGVHPMHIGLAGMPMVHPSLLYNHQSEASPFFAQQRPASIFQNMPITSSGSEADRSKASCTKGSLVSVPVDSDNSSQFDGWGLSAERSLCGGSLTDDDILEMTYEEYLEAYSRDNRKSLQPLSGASRKIQKLPASREHGDDSYSRRHSSKRTHRQSVK